MSHVVATLLLLSDVTSLAVLARSVSTPVASTRAAVTSAPTVGEKRARRSRGSVPAMPAHSRCDEHPG